MSAEPAPIINPGRIPEYPQSGLPARLTENQPIVSWDEFYRITREKGLSRIRFIKKSA